MNRRGSIRDQKISRRVTAGSGWEGDIVEKLMLVSMLMLILLGKLGVMRSEG